MTSDLKLAVECRSLDCEDDAMLFVDIMHDHQKYKVLPDALGAFCVFHAQRLLDTKADLIASGREMLRIRSIDAMDIVSRKGMRR